MIVIQEDWYHSVPGSGEITVLLENRLRVIYTIKAWHIVNTDATDHECANEETVRWLVMTLLRIRHGEHANKIHEADLEAEPEWLFRVILERCTRKEKIDWCQACSCVGKCEK